MVLPNAVLCVCFRFRYSRTSNLCGDPIGRYALQIKSVFILSSNAYSCLSLTSAYTSRGSSVKDQNRRQFINTPRSKGEWMRQRQWGDRLRYGKDETCISSYVVVFEPMRIAANASATSPTKSMHTRLYITILSDAGHNGNKASAHY